MNDRACRWAALGLFALSSASANADVVAIGGDVALREPPSSILLNQWESDLEIRGWFEREVVLSSGLTLGHVLPGYIDDQDDLHNGSVGAGTMVRSYMVRIDPVGVGPVIATGFVVFDTPILGVYVGSQLEPTDPILQRPGITYNANSYRGLELDGAAESEDAFEISADRSRIDFVMDVGEWTDDIRIVTSVISFCLADYNRDQIEDILDFLDFIDDFSACDQSAAPCGVFGNPDVNGDTTIDILDFLRFIDAFSTGC